MKSATALVLVLVACGKSGDSTTSATPAPTKNASPGTFKVDPGHSTILFEARHESAGNLYGWFKDFDGTFTIDPDPAKCHIEITVKAASVDTRDQERDGNIAGPDFLNAKQFPDITFKSTKVEAAAGGWRVTGDLSIHGVTKSVTATATQVGDTKDPRGTHLVGVEAHLTIARGDFGVTFMPEMVGPQLELVIALEGDGV